ncbi:MAG TPA: thiamine pyrophosphate-binding protein [Burkholderiaceae bacterium]|nr:thiamine pyrophosphate-binding protein [Burkholderiaceae bacterium]
MTEPKKIRVAEYVGQFLAERGVKHVFMLTGGGAMFLNDALGFNPAFRPVFHHHEQACAMAAEGYARVADAIGVVNVTTGPGGINALNGVFGAWTDSVPMLVLSGQVKRETCLATSPVEGMRQLGDQEAEIVRMVEPITKYAVVLADPLRVRYELEKAYLTATTGRPGPVWIDIPIDVQSSLIEPETLVGYDAPEATPTAGQASLDDDVRFVLDRLSRAERPVVLAGTGVRAARALGEFDAAIRALHVPVLTAWTHDLIGSDDPLFCGRPGTIGTRAGNFVAQSSDVMLVIGSRLNIRQTSYNYAGFAPGAFKIQIDIDPAELRKPTVQINHGICRDAKVFLKRLAELAPEFSFGSAAHRRWLAWAKERATLYPQVQPKHREWRGKINPYHFIEVLFGALQERDIVVTGNATACITSFQAGDLKKGQRLFSNSGSASMGYDLPAAIGASFAAPPGASVVCLAGDGSIQMNIQELQTLAHYQLPVKIFVLNNNGYLSIRTSQGNFFKRLVGEGPANGVSFPDYTKVAAAYGIPARRLDTPEFATGVHEALATPGPLLCEVMLDDAQQFEPRMSSRQLDDGRIVTPPLEDMFPFLSREELASNVLRP